MTRSVYSTIGVASEARKYSPVAHSHHQRAALTCGNERVGALLVEHGYGVSPHHLLQSQLHGGLKVGVTVHLRVLYELHQHLSVGVRAECVALLLKALLQHRVVLYDSVVNDGQTLRLRVVRVGVLRVRLAMCSPSCVCYAYCSRSVLLGGQGLQFCHLALGLVDVELSLRVDECHSGTVIASILQAVQTLDEHRIGLAMAYVTYYSAHKFLVFF